MAIKVEITHPDRVLFPDDGITKRDLADYYAEVADVMVPHLKGRPLTLWRYPRGIDQKGFVQQDFGGALPDWMGSAEVAKEGGTVVHPVADRREGLVWLANQNCVTVHSWLSRHDRLDAPDQIIFDLDPSTSDFAAVRATARACADVLDDLGLAAYLKTTGSRGLHVVVPLQPRARLRHGPAVRPRCRRCGRRRRPRPPHRRAAQGQPRRPDLPRRDAQRLRADGSRAVRGARPPRRTGRHAAGVGGTRPPRLASRPIHDPRHTEADSRERRPVGGSAAPRPLAGSPRSAPGEDPCVSCPTSRVTGETSPPLCPAAGCARSTWEAGLRSGVPAANRPEQ